MVLFSPPFLRRVVCFALLWVVLFSPSSAWVVLRSSLPSFLWIVLLGGPTFQSFFCVVVHLFGGLVFSSLLLEVLIASSFLFGVLLLSSHRADWPPPSLGGVVFLSSFCCAVLTSSASLKWCCRFFFVNLNVT